MNTNEHFAAIRLTLVRRAGESPDAGAVAQAVLDIWHGMAAQLAPVIGARGVEVLFTRAQHLTSVAFPLLASAEEHGDMATILASLRLALERQDSAVAAEAGCALLGTFLDILTTLIGEPLTERLLGPVWEAPSPPKRESSP